ncbi:MAG: UDP-2,3-diacylglucosamine diphosphatase [Methylococcales bacterium]|nr:UDP-2,3-diacylglucosamine diphosphatase [Methylococcales bacterium]
MSSIPRSDHQTIFFISDLHLALEKPKITQNFLNFLTNEAKKATKIYILGDLFDVWLGDDDFMPPINKIKYHLKELTESGVMIYLQQGNRDFLLGQQFCQQTGLILLDEYSVINLFGIDTLLTHGDLLCSDDLAYQAFREKSHSKAWQQNVLSKPLVLRLLVARWYRVRSFFHKKNKSSEIMDVNQNTVIEIMQHYQVTRLIHGHTHRPALHNFKINENTAQRFVLSEWSKNTVNLLSWNSQGYQMVPLKT